MQPLIEAYSTDGELLWSYPSEKGDETLAVNDVWPADLDGDGLDEVIIGYNGGGGVHVLDPEGHLLWKNTDRGNIWHVAAGNVGGNARPQVLTTSADGKVHIFDAKGKHLRYIDPGLYTTMVRTWQQTELSNQPYLSNQHDSEKHVLDEQRASTSEQTQVRKKLAERALESLIRSRNELVKRIRGQRSAEVNRGAEG